MSGQDEEVAVDGGREGARCFVIVHNISKRHNIGTLARSATAFGVEEVCLVGSNQYNTFGSHGASDYVAYRHFHTLPECTTWLRHQGCQIVGVEITDNARPVHQQPFTGHTAFMLGNEMASNTSARWEEWGQGCLKMRECDAFVYISQYGSGTASLNVTVAASIVLHHFAVWAGYSERPRTGGKYDVAQRPLRTVPRGLVCNPDDLAAQREQRRAARCADWQDHVDGFASLDVEDHCELHD